MLPSYRELVKFLRENFHIRIEIIYDVKMLYSFSLSFKFQKQQNYT
jgi:hypothetical protein